MEQKTKTFTIGEILTDSEIEAARQLYAQVKQRGIGFPQNLNAQLREKIIKPNLERINKALGQENDAGYLAYAVEYAIGKERNEY